MIGNKNGNKAYKLACCNCGTKVDLMQVAHRNSLNYVIGYLFLCEECMPLVAGKAIVRIESPDGIFHHDNGRASS